MENEIIPYNGKISEEFLAKARRMYDKYKADKEELHRRIVSNNRWYKAQYGKMLNPVTNETEPATAFIFSAIENKYADAIDNFPIPNLLEREPSDVQTAKILSKIIPVQLDMSGFKRVYKDNWRRKLKHGTAVYGIFYNEQKNDIDIKAVDLMSIYCDMHVRDVQDSQFLFIVNAVDNDILREEYPDFKALFHGDTDIKSYSGTHRVEDRTEITDCYYKKADGTLHMIKFAGTTVIDATEDLEGYERGLYEHGLYPVIFDVLYPEEDSPFGFGVVDAIRNPQQYIDKLDGIIIKNALLAGKQRFLIKENGNVNEDEFRDYSNDIVHVTGSVDETNIKPLQANTLPNQVLEHRVEKINELKEIIGNRDFQQGGTTGGVIAASAISSMQQMGQKISRALIDDSYDAYKAIVRMVIDLMREFYDAEKVYRITNETGAADFAPFDNSMLMKKNEKRDALGFVSDVEYTKTEFDIDVIPQRENPFAKESNNQTILSLWNGGFFLPQNYDVSIIALQCMNFDGKEKLIEQIQELKKRQQQGTAQGQPMQAQQGMPQGQQMQAQQGMPQGQPMQTQHGMPSGASAQNNPLTGIFGGAKRNDQLVEVGIFGGAKNNDQLIEVGYFGGKENRGGHNSAGQFTGGIK